MKGPRQDVIERLLDAAAGLTKQDQLESEAAVILWLRQRHKIDVARVNVAADLRRAERSLERAGQDLERAREQLNLAELK